MGAGTAFLVALSTAVYGMLLAVYLLSGWLGSKFPGPLATRSGGAGGSWTPCRGSKHRVFARQA
jgi:hypothetical protein